MKARPTEYKGIRFRSKSEAVFARYLDLLLDVNAMVDAGEAASRGNMLSRGCGGFEYEPTTLVDGWHPDFMFWFMRAPRKMFVNNFCSNVPIFELNFYEYKPTRPTQTYVTEWFKNAALWKQLAADESFEYAIRTCFAIYYGSPFSDCERGIIRFEPSVYTEPTDWVSEFPELMEYRFDLADGGAPCSR